MKRQSNVMNDDDEREAGGGGVASAAASCWPDDLSKILRYFKVNLRRMM